MQSVLFADADPTLRSVNCWLLSLVEFQVETAAGGVECLEKLFRNKPDFLVLNLELPWGGGDAVLEIMREERELMTIPVVLTAAASALQLERMAAPPVILTVRKPYSMLSIIEELKRHHAPQRGQPAGLTKRRGVLVVADEQNIRDLLRTVLVAVGFEVWTAPDAAAMHDYHDHIDRVALVLVDAPMPQCDGARLLERFRALNPALPLCAMSDELTYEAQHELLAKGCWHIFSKPLQVDNVARVVSFLARHSWSAQPARHQIEGAGRRLREKPER